MTPSRAFRITPAAADGAAAPGGVSRLCIPGPWNVAAHLGWRLDQMSWVPRAGFRAEGYFLFRRDVGALQAD